jgi:hypothetical protein
MLPSSARVLRSAWLYHFMDAITHCPSFEARPNWLPFINCLHPCRPKYDIVDLSEICSCTGAYLIWLLLKLVARGQTFPICFLSANCHCQLHEGIWVSLQMCSYSCCFKSVCCGYLYLLLSTVFSLPTQVQGSSKHVYFFPQTTEMLDCFLKLQTEHSLLLYLLFIESYFMNNFTSGWLFWFSDSWFLGWIA